MKLQNIIFNFTVFDLIMLLTTIPYSLSQPLKNSAMLLGTMSTMSRANELFISLWKISEAWEKRV